ncbi:MAG: hypothetical protein H0X37_15290 [Herpetosiphonaceae bacterium]|nr:hypothetical protein [Herpetosiphonaceae bacterium]
MGDEQHKQDKLQKMRSYPKSPVTEQGKRYQVRVQRRTEALEMRKRGETYMAIAEALGISARQARVDVQIALTPEQGQERERAAELRAMEEQRLTMAVKAIEPKVKEGDLGAVGRWVQVSERRARLMGLDLPPQPATKGGNDGRVTIQVRYVDDVEP